MQITVSGRQVDTGESLRTYVEDRCDSALKKYFERTVDAHVTFSRVRREFRCDCTAHLSTGLVAQAHGKSTEPYAAFDAAMERLEKQLRRYKRRLRNHHERRSEPVATANAAAYVLASQDEETDQTADNEDQPIIIAETTTKIRSLTVGEAVMQLEISHAPVLVFRNEAHGDINVVYVREDGNVGWIDPRELREAV